MIEGVATYGHAATAILFALLGLWQFSLPERRKAMRVLALAFLLTAAWAALAAIYGPQAPLARAGETVRNISYLGFFWFLMQRGLDREQRPFLGLLNVALFAVALMQLTTDIFFIVELERDLLAGVTYGSTSIFHLLFAIGALVVAQAIYTSSAPETRWGLRLTMAALAAMWAYDLNLYTIAWLTERTPFELLAVRGVLMAALIPYFVLSMRRGSEWKVHLSRKVTFRSLSMLAIGGYFLAMYFATQAIDMFAGRHAISVQIGIVLLMSAAAVILIPSARVRSWFKVKLAKHLFEHRYDYRAEWIRFNETLARPGENSDPLDIRVVRALAEITDSPGGLLFEPDGDGRLLAGAQWNWHSLETAHEPAPLPLSDWMRASAHIVEIDALRREGDTGAARVATLLPDWIVEAPKSWALVPLIHRGALTGAVLLERPRVDRELDWEDLDLLRIAGRQAASYLAEARGQEQLAEARRFDEFNRRFAFIMHDLKNLVSQLSLVARNAERHADNPEFRADMIATIQDSVGKMNDMLARLAPQERGKAEALRSVCLLQLARSVAAQKEAAHPIAVEGEGDRHVLAAPARLETALLHLVQNAIDASPANVPVRILVDGDQAGRISVIDGGAGMDEAFVRDRLFRPFSSSKPDGFGIGAYEARSLVAEMGGTLTVESAPGKGSRFSITLSDAPTDAAPETERMIA